MNAEKIRILEKRMAALEKTVAENELLLRYQLRFNKHVATQLSKKSQEETRIILP